MSWKENLGHRWPQKRDMHIFFQGYHLMHLIRILFDTYVLCEETGRRSVTMQYICQRGLTFIIWTIVRLFFIPYFITGDHGIIWCMSGVWDLVWRFDIDWLFFLYSASLAQWTIINGVPVCINSLDRISALHHLNALQYKRTKGKNVPL